MASAAKASMVIRLVNGKHFKIAFDQPDDELLAMRRIDEALKARHLVIELPDRALIIPIGNIMSIESFGPRKRFPSFAIRNAHLVG